MKLRGKEELDVAARSACPLCRAMALADGLVAGVSSDGTVVRCLASKAEVRLYRRRVACYRLKQQKGGSGA